LNFVPYWDLKVYELAFQSAMNIYDFSTSWPEAERDALTAPVRRASRQVCVLLAQAWQQRRLSPESFVSKLSKATSAVTETMVWLDFAVQSNYLDRGNYEQLLTNYDDVGMILARMMLDFKNWE
jgi:four helix bundle protein